MFPKMQYKLLKQWDLKVWANSWVCFTYDVKPEVEDTGLGTPVCEDCQLPSVE